MNNKKILLFARDPGGCNSIAPLYKAMQDHNLDCLLYAKDFSFEKMQNQYLLSPKNISLEVDTINYESILNWLRSIKPTFVITGTSYGDTTELLIWKSCKELNIPCMAILDHWVNYGVRFKYNLNESIYPEYVIVPDKVGLEIAIREDIPSQNVFAWGNPYYEYLSKLIFSEERIQQIKAKYNHGEGSRKLLVFASEPFSLAPVTYGFNEKIILESLIYSLSQLHETADFNFTLLVRPHPKEDAHALNKLCKKFKNLKFEIVVSSEENALELIMASDLCLGMMSQFLIESYYLKKRALSLQLGRNTEDPFILTQQKKMLRVDNESNLVGAIRSELSSEIDNDQIYEKEECIKKILNELK